jgi:Uma2 family endonuclease
MTIMSVAPVPDWLFPPEGGFEATDLDRLPDLPPHTELIDGSLVLVSPQASFHTLALYVLEHALRRTVPPDLRVRREMTVTLGRRQRPEPDLTIVRAEAAQDLTATSFAPDDVVLIVEVVSPESRERDRKRKPSLYAEAGIQHFWLVENENCKPILQTYMLDPVAMVYRQTGIHKDLVNLDVPYPIKIDFSEIDLL